MTARDQTLVLQLRRQPLRLLGYELTSLAEVRLVRLEQQLAESSLACSSPLLLASSTSLTVAS